MAMITFLVRLEFLVLELPDLPGSNVWAFRHWKTSRPEGLKLCPSYPSSQVLKNSYGVTTAKVDVVSESRPWSTALVIKIWVLGW